MAPLTNKEIGSNVNQKSSNVGKGEFEGRDAKNCYRVRDYYHIQVSVKVKHIAYAT